MTEAVKETDEVLDDNTAEDLKTHIFQGFREWELNDKKYRTRFATPKEEDSARWLYSRAFNRGLIEGIPTEDEMLTILEKRGIWGDEDEKEMSKLQEQIGSLELILADKNPKDKSSKTKKLAQELLETRTSYLQKANIKNKYLEQTIESLSEGARQSFLFSTCTEHEDGTPVWPTPEDYLNEKDQELIGMAVYQYTTFTNGLAEDYISELTEMKILTSKKDSPES